LEPILCLV